MLILEAGFFNGYLVKTNEDAWILETNNESDAKGIARGDIRGLDTRGQAYPPSVCGEF